MCDGECTDVTSAHDHCGSCTNACASAQVCNSGQCSSTCSGTTTSCSGSCVDTKTSANNCNGCGISCGAGRVCNNGACGCPSGQTLCSNGSCAVSCNSGGLGGTPGGGLGGTPGGGQGGSPGGGFGGSPTTGQGGSPVGGQGGAPGGQGGFTGAVPAGWWTASTWHGCAWTGIDNVTLAPHRTTITPTDFTAGQAATGSYHVNGIVGQDPVTGPNTGYGGVALLGFNLNQNPAGASCVYNPAAATQAGPPGVTFPAGPAGIAVNFSKTAGTGVVRIQIQAADGATNPAHRWCYGLTQVQGKDFAPFSRFYTQCYNDDGNGTAKPNTSLGAVYDKAIPISAIVFLVPGTNNMDLSYDFTVNGFALGNVAADAPNGGTAGTLTGMIGGADPAGSTNADFQRVKVTGGTPQHSYIIQNNNWGQPANTQQSITYTNNSFVVTSSTGNPGSNVPASFPSIYVGHNGNTMAGAYSTISDDGLPKQISATWTANTTFTWSGGTNNGNYNATYDVWFNAATPNLTTYPQAGYPEYQDGVSGFLMVWLYKPGQNNPIGGTPAHPGVTVPNVPGTWNVYIGQRGTGPNPGAPVISYVAASKLQTLTFNLKDFINHSVTNGYGLQNSWYLTDVFAGFEIWSGPDATNLKVDNFTFDLR